MIHLSTHNHNLKPLPKIYWNSNSYSRLNCDQTITYGGKGHKIREGRGFAKERCRRGGLK
jgi:hypothetical protein